MNHNQNILLLSTSTLHGGLYLAYCLTEIADLFRGVKQIVFIPYARPSGISLDAYTRMVSDKFSEINIQVKGLHEIKSPSDLNLAGGFFAGGGNTFLLLKSLYSSEYMATIAQLVENGKPYLGSSAGTNIAGLTIGTTNDMPIVYPPSFNSFGFVPFNINPHYLDPMPVSTHMGETRETRVKEFHFQNDQPVLGLREGSWLRLYNGQLTLGGKLTARLFKKSEDPREILPGNISELVF